MESILVFHLTLANSLWLLVGFELASLYVYQSNSPYRMVATFPLDGHDIHSVALSDDNTVAATHEDYDHFWLNIHTTSTVLHRGISRRSLIHPGV